jgi:hypothetical protein
MKTRQPVKTPADVNGIAIHCAHTEMADPNDLQPNPQNPKKHSKKQIELYAKIIREGGWRRPIMVSNRSGLIVAGHGAQLAAIKLGLRSVPIDRQSFPSEAAENAAMLADNWLAEVMVEYDQTLSAEIVNELRDSGIDLELAGVLESLADEGIKTHIIQLDLKVPLKMAWVLIGIPTVKYGTINTLVEKIGRMKDVVMETTQTADEISADQISAG